MTQEDAIALIENLPKEDAIEIFENLIDANLQEIEHYSEHIKKKKVLVAQLRQRLNIVRSCENL